jgi:hypothetical protein
MLVVAEVAMTVQVPLVVDHPEVLVVEGMEVIQLVETLTD